MLPKVEFSWKVRQELEPIIEKLKEENDSMLSEINSITSERDSIASERDSYRQKLIDAGIDPDA